MKKIIFFLFLSIFSFGQNLEEIREKYPLCKDSKEAILDLESLLTSVSKNSKNKTLVAYKGASITLNAKIAKTIKEKKQLFIEGANLLEYALKQEPNNVEIRLIRLSIQENSPKILKYKSEITNDKNSILKNYSNQSKDLKEYIKKYAKSSKVFSKEEISSMK